MSHDISDSCLEDGSAVTASGKHEFFNIKVSELVLILSVEGVNDFLCERGLPIKDVFIGFNLCLRSAQQHGKCEYFHHLYYYRYLLNGT